MFVDVKTSIKESWNQSGELTPMVQRVLCMHKVPGSKPGSSTLILVFFFCEECLMVSKRLPKQLEVKGGISSDGRARA